MTQLPKKLQEARDELAGAYCWPLGHEPGLDTKLKCYMSGFESCFEILAPEIEKLVEVLELVDKQWFEDEPGIACWDCDMGESGRSKKGHGHHDDDCSVQAAHNSLITWREFTGEK